MTIRSNTILHIWKLLREMLKVLITRKKNYNYVWSLKLTRFMMVTILQYIQIQNHYDVLLNVNYTAKERKTKNVNNQKGIYVFIKSEYIYLMNQRD